MTVGVAYERGARQPGRYRGYVGPVGGCRTEARASERALDFLVALRCVGAVDIHSRWTGFDQIASLLNQAIQTRQINDVPAAARNHGVANRDSA